MPASTPLPSTAGYKRLAFSGSYRQPGIAEGGAASERVNHPILIGLFSLWALACCGSSQAAESVAAPLKTSAVDARDRLGEMVSIPAGPFLMGNNGHEGFGGSEEFPQHSVNLPAYQIGKYEVTRGEFRMFIQAGGYTNSSYWSAAGWKWKESEVIDYTGMRGAVTHTVRPNREEKRCAPEHWAAEQEWIGHGFGHPRFTQTDRHPVVGVTYYEAEAYCKWAGGRLPTEAEWEKAARWDEKKQHAGTWPWGDTWDPEACNNPEDHHPAGGGYRVNQSAPVGSYRQGASPYGCMDMVGNAYEWVADWAQSYPGNPQPFDHTHSYHWVKGGCWDDGPLSVRCAYRGWYLPPSSSGTGPGDSDYIGFRVAR
jgi:gamma-glutamyl hercynylcysteine S-oxide synthase